MRDTDRAATDAPAESLVRLWIRELWLPWSKKLDPEVFDDLVQEARLALSRLADTPPRVPAAERGAYAHSCVRRAVWRVLRRELRHARWSVSLERLEIEEVLAPAGGTPVGGHGASQPDDLLHYLGRPEIADAFLSLQGVDREILSLAFVGGLTDAEIGTAVGRTTAGVTKRRQRALARLAKILRLYGGGVGAL